ncbi:hypothetical protein [uncultured Bacteroides sp.]|uniref:hypothetical protein n=1 Tax=uncultured Bacteroides sp. TaxID=162156 RepID=UPI0025D4A123|nr:hypothetical protein [uncultured Bacteroides sp.]
MLLIISIWRGYFARLLLSVCSSPVRFRLSASACLSVRSPQSYSSVWLSAFDSYPEGR